MYQSSASGGSAGGGQLGSAPSSFRSSTVSVAVPASFFPSEEACYSSAMANHSEDADSSVTNTSIGLGPSYGFSVASPSSFPASLARHSSSPAVFINRLAAAVSADKNGGFPMTRGVTSCNQKRVDDSGTTRLSYRSESLSRISEESHHQNKQMKSEYQPRLEATHPILFPAAAATSHHDALSQFCMSQATMNMASMDKMLNIPLDSVPCKIRAKRGCATHPRSIAERERRTRISGKLKNLQDLVPNMDKQTSYSDMLHLAIQHIKSLQNQVQKLNKDLEGCSCGSKRCRNL